MIPSLTKISQYGMLLFGLSVVLNLALFFLAFLKG